ATALNPYIGYEAAAKVAQESLAAGRGVRKTALDKGLISEEEATRLFDPLRLVNPRPLPRRRKVV
ncbi:MAG: hypothetical protein Q8O76_04845, partial [Chloroflexota bacterium]|nr:hypothetical protein [Chloroflexota bacterium]